MATVYVIHAEDATSFVRERLLRPLPANGYDCWLTRDHLAATKPEEYAIAQALDQCQAILIVLSPAVANSETSREEIEIALTGRTALIVVQTETLKEQDAAHLPSRLWALPQVDFGVEQKEEAIGLLVGLLPPVGSEMETMTPKDAERIEWNEKIFSDALTRATRRHDHTRAEALVTYIVRHLKHRPSAYPPEKAAPDMKALRQEREFELMLRYGDAVVKSGTTGKNVRPFFAQALIETGHYESALEVLHSVLGDPASEKNERYEAQGLIGRIFKQLYINNPKAAEAAGRLRQSIAAYETAYNDDPNNFWHGVNAASCILRAERDGIEGAPPGLAQKIAGKIDDDLEQLSRKGPLEVWDCASRVEALLALERYDEAEEALDVYLNHPDMRAFEVSSTFRQYDQVLELDRNPRGKPILDRLRAVMERYRAGNAAAGPASTRSAETESVAEAVRTMPLVIRLADPAWEPQGVTDLVIQTRLGKIVTARGSDATVRELLADSTVISVEESRPAGRIECDRSMPFIRTAAEYPHVGGPYKETGDGALIAIIDDGIDVLHEAFRDAHGKSRIVGIWDQNAAAGTPPPGFSYGAFHDAKAIAGYVKAGTVPAGLGRNDGGHGTHVASIAGGRAAGDFAGGVAPDAKLLIVVSGGSGPNGFAQSYIEALAFIDARARELKLPVVVNLSQGLNTGAHDGTSTIEGAFDSFSGTGRVPGRVVVKSAGNERDKGGHARVTLKSGSLEPLRWIREPGADFTERIELWWTSANEIEFRLGEPVAPVKRPNKPAPPANWSSWVGTAAPECEGKFPKGGPFRLVFTKRHVDNGDSLLVIELGNATEPAALGDWLLEIKGVTIKERGDIHCWIERSQGLPTSFQYPHVDENMTLSIPGTAEGVITVSAVDAREPIQVGYFSSYGPTRDGRENQPLVCAPGVEVRAAKGGTDHDVFPDNGTSMAAPHVTGAIALLLSRAAKKGQSLSGKQIASALRQKTRNYDGTWDRGQGYGVIDVTAFLAAFD